jgi:hypothetical protein
LGQVSFSQATSPSPIRTGSKPFVAVSDAYKQAVIAAGIGDTRTVGREIGMIRTLRNDFIDEME